MGFALARYNGDGSLDTTWNTDGKVVNNFGDQSFSAVIALQPNGKILLAGQIRYSSTGADFALARYTSDGELDPLFGVDGFVSTNFVDFDDTIYGLVIQSDGKIVVAGSANIYYSKSEFGLARYLGDRFIYLPFVDRP